MGTGTSAEGEFAESARVLAWLAEARPRLVRSRWARALALDGRDLLDCAVSHASIVLLRCVRPAVEAAPAPRRSVRERASRRWADLRHDMGIRRASDRPGGADVWFWPREPGHLASHVPAARILEERGVRTCFVVSTTKGFDALSGTGLRVTWTHARWPDLALSAALASAVRIRALPEDPGVSLPELAGSRSGCAIASLRRALIEALPLVMEARDTARRVAALRPRLVVIGNDLTAEGRAGQDVLARLGIPTASMSHGLAAGNPLSAYHAVDRMLVYGDTHRRHLIAMGIPEDRVAVVGAPHLDHRPVQTGLRREDVASALGADPRRPFVLIALSGAGHTISESHHEATVRALALCSAKLPDVDFVVKLHRKDSPDLYRAIEAQTPGARLLLLPPRVAVTSEISDWLQGARAVITGASTSALDAMVHDVPVVTVDLVGALTWVDFIRAGATFHATTEAGVEAAVRRALGEPRALQERVAAYLIDSYGPLDGRSAERSADALLDVMGGR